MQYGIGILFYKKGEKEMEEQILNTLKKLLDCQTYKDNKKEFQKIFKMIKEDYSTDLYYKKYTFKGKNAVVIANTEETTLDIIFCTHIDVVPATTYAYYEDEENIYGRGTIDMKGSVAVLLEILKHRKTDKKIALFITSDEEEDGNCANELLNRYTSKLAIVPDGGTNFNLIKEEKGLLQLKISIQTIAAHASQPFNGKNAITELFNIYTALIEEYPLPTKEEEYITSINLSILNGGIAKNQVPDEAYMVLDIRHIAKDTKEEIISKIQKINPEAKIEIVVQGPVFQTDLTNPEIKKYLQICKEVLKRPIQIVGCESTSDAVYFSERHIPTIIMNPDGYYAHCPNEYVNKHSLYQLYQIYSKFIESEEKNNE